MKNIIKDFKLTSLVEPKFIKASLAKYNQNNINKSWEIVQTHDSVAILIYHKEREAFVLVKQFRPAVYMNNNNGLTVELCAGIIDKDLDLVEIAKEEIEEECGYRVDIQNMEKITSFYTSVGFAGSKQTLYYVEVAEDMRVSNGGGVDAELIEVVYMPLKRVKTFIYDENIAKTPGIIFALMWWFDNKSKIL